MNGFLLYLFTDVNFKLRLNCYYNSIIINQSLIFLIFSKTVLISFTVIIITTADSFSTNIELTIGINLVSKLLKKVFKS